MSKEKFENRPEKKESSDERHIIPKHDERIPTYEGSVRDKPVTDEGTSFETSSKQEKTEGE